MKERGFIKKYEAVFSPSKAVEGLTREQWLEKVPEVDAIIVLGSGLKKSDSDEMSQLNLHGKMRTIAAYELYKAGKAKEIIVTGGVPIKGDYDRSMAEAEDKYLTDNLDVPSEDVIKEPGESSESTLENFENIISVLRDRNIKSVIIVSNGYHTPRAEALFKKIVIKNGLSVEAMSIPAEEILLERSLHYRKLVEHYDISGKALEEHPEKVLEYLKKEGLGLVLAYLDKNDNIAKKRAVIRKKDRESNKELAVTKK